jgi:hypothetical protein
MEKLSRNVGVKLLPDFPQQNLYLCSAQTIETLEDNIAPESKHFGLLLAVDGHSLDSDRISRAARKLIQKGLASFCAWGPGCERIHDVFDEVAVKLDPKQSNAVIMTTWHDDETLQAYQRTCEDWIFAPIGCTEWENIIRTVVASPGELEED